MTRRHLSLMLVVLLLTGVVFAVGAGTAGVSAQVPANTLDSITVGVAACDGFAGRIDAVVTTDGTHAFLGNNTSGGSFNVGSLGAGTHTKDTQYFGLGVPANTVLTITVTLGSAAFLDDYGSKTISFNCTTGEVVDPTTLTVSPVSPTPTPAGTKGAVTITIHIGDDVTFDGISELHILGGMSDWSEPYYVSVSAMTGNGYPGEDCAINAHAPPWRETGCVFLASVGDDFVFTLWPAVTADAPVESTHDIYVFLLHTGLPLSPSGNTVLEVSAAAPPTTSSTTTSTTTTSTTSTTTTTSTTSTTLPEDTSTTTTSGSEVLGDALTTSTTVAPATTEDTLPATGSREDLNRTALLGFALVLVGIVTLSGAAVIGQHRRQ